MRLEPVIDAALQLDSLKERWNQLNLLVLHLWPRLREMFPKNPQSNGGSGQGGTQAGSGGTQSPQNSGGRQKQGQSQNSSGGGQQPQVQPSPQFLADAIAKE